MEDPEKQKRLKALFEHFLTSNPENALKFHARFFTENPQTTFTFPRLQSVGTVEDLKHNNRLSETHVQKVISSIRYFLENIGDVNSTRAEALKIYHLQEHISNKICESHYWLMFNSLLESIEESCATSKQGFTDDDRSLWLDFANWIHNVFTAGTPSENDAESTNNEKTTKNTEHGCL